METLDFQKIGLELKRLRTANNYTQEQIADGLNCTIAFVSNFENNRAKINLRIVHYYSQLCNVTVDSILNAGKETATEQTTQILDSEILHLFHQFSEEEQAKIIKILHCLKAAE